MATTGHFTSGFSKMSSPEADAPGDRLETLPLGERWFPDGFDEVPRAGGVVQCLADMTQAREALRLLREARIPATLTHLIVRAAALAAARKPESHQMLCEYRRLTPGAVDIGLSMAGQTSYAPVVVLPASDRKHLSELIPSMIDAIDAASEKEARDIATLKRWGWVIPFGFVRRLLIRWMNRSLWFRRRLVGTFQVSYLPTVEVNVPLMFYTGSVLGVGGVRDRAVVVAGRVVPRPTSWLTLCADHAALDGIKAGDLLGAVKAVLESDELVREAREAAAKREVSTSGPRPASGLVLAAVAGGGAAR
jgi:hypothetical protein